MGNKKSTLAVYVPEPTVFHGPDPPKMCAKCTDVARGFYHRHELITDWCKDCFDAIMESFRLQRLVEVTTNQWEQMERRIYELQVEVNELKKQKPT